MSVWPQLSNFVVLVPIVGLLLLGLLVAVTGGVASLSHSQDRRTLAANLTSVLLRVAGYLAGLIAVHRFIGAPMEVGW